MGSNLNRAALLVLFLTTGCATTGPSSGKSGGVLGVFKKEPSPPPIEVQSGSQKVSPKEFQAVETKLLGAIRRDDVKAVKSMLASQGIDPKRAHFEQGLFSNKVHPGQVFSANGVFHTPLSFSIQVGSEKVFAHLMSLDVEVNVLPKGVLNEIGIAIQNRREGMALALINNGADVHRLLDEGTKRSALIDASARGLIRVVGSILEREPDLNWQDKRGRTALMAAAEFGHLEVVDALLTAGADPKIKGENGKTASDLAGYRNRAAILERLSRNP